MAGYSWTALGHAEPSCLRHCSYWGNDSAPIEHVLPCRAVASAHHLRRYRGNGGGIIDASTTGLISGIYTEKRGVALNLFTLLYPLSSTLISFIAGGLFVLFHDDPRPPVLVTIGVVAIAMLSVFFLPRPFSAGSATQQERVSSLPQLVQRVTALLPLLFPVIIAMLLTTGFTATIRTWTPAYLHVRYGQSPATASVLSGLTNGFAIVFRLLASLLIARVGSWRTILVGMLVAIGGLLGMLGSPSAFTGTIALIVTAIGLTPLVATFVSIGNERAGGLFGSVSGLLLFVTGVSNVLCSGLFGVILNQAGPSWAVIFSLICMACGGIVVLYLPRYRFQ